MVGNLCSERKRDDLLASCIAKAASRAFGGKRRRDAAKLRADWRQQAPSFQSNPISLPGQLVSWDSASFETLGLIPFAESLNHLQCIPAFAIRSSLAKCGQWSPLGEPDRELLGEGPAPHRQVAPRPLLCPRALSFSSFQAHLSTCFLSSNWCAPVRVCMCTCVCVGGGAGEGLFFQN